MFRVVPVPKLSLKKENIYAEACVEHASFALRLNLSFTRSLLALLDAIKPFSKLKRAWIWPQRDFWKT